MRVGIAALNDNILSSRLFYFSTRPKKQLCALMAHGLHINKSWMPDEEYFIKKFNT